MSKYKYQLNHRLSLLPRGVYLENVIEQLEGKYGIAAGQFDQDRFIEAESAMEIPMDRLLIYADLFGVELKMLLPETVTAVPG